QELGRILSEPALMTQARARAHGGEWLPQALQARRKPLQEALTQLERQQARLLEVSLAEIIGRDEVEHQRQEVTHTHHRLAQQRRQLAAQAQPQVDIAALAHGLEAFCRRLQPPWTSSRVPNADNWWSGSSITSSSPMTRWRFAMWSPPAPREKPPHFVMCV